MVCLDDVLPTVRDDDEDDEDDPEAPALGSGRAFVPVLGSIFNSLVFFFSPLDFFLIIFFLGLSAAVPVAPPCEGAVAFGFVPLSSSCLNGSSSDM